MIRIRGQGMHYVNKVQMCVYEQIQFKFRFMF